MFKYDRDFLKMAQELQRIEISSKTIFFIVGVGVAIWFIIQILPIIVLLFVSLILVSALHSPVDFLESKKIPRFLAIIIVYLLLFALVSGVFTLIIPQFISQTRDLIDRSPVIFDELNKVFVFYQIPTQDVVSRIAGELRILSPNFFKITAGFFSSLLGVVTLLALTFYLLLEWPKIIRLVSSAFAGKQEERIKVILEDIERGLGSWVRGELVLMFSIGILSYIGLVLLGVPYALSLAVLAGLLEIIAILGPIIATIPAVLAALLVSPILAVAVIALYFIIQQLENNIIVPNVMRKAVGVNPLITIIALMIGVKLAGILGAVLAVPAVVLIRILVTDILRPEGEEVPEDSEL